MFVLYAICVSLVLVFVDLLFLKTFQLEGYKIFEFVKKMANLDFAKGNKNKLVFTKRIKRLIFLDFLMKFLFFLIIFKFIHNIWWLISLLIIFLVFSHFLVSLTFLIAVPCEVIIKKFYICKAKNKLKKINCKKIAITGSFGKTSTKNILYQILKEEFDVCATPKSFNTPMGICRTILENLKETDDFLIVEYGARHCGDINFLAKNFGVDFGIVTPIGNCHLETFGSLQNIENEKYCLCEEAKDVVVFNGKSKSTKKLFDRFPKKKYLVCCENSFAFAKNISTNNFGSEFLLVLDNHEFLCRTKLLGKSSIDNIVCCSAMAYLLKESVFSIQKAIEKLQPMPHRLQLIRTEFANIIDDSYNSNLEGFLEALEVVKTFNGNKIVVSPGLVELGKLQQETNIKAGKFVGEVADFFLIMNQTNRASLLKGAIQGGMKEENIYFANTREEQKRILKKIIKKGDVVLFENDFPDNLK